VASGGKGKYFSKGKEKIIMIQVVQLCFNLSHPYKLFYILSLQKEEFSYSASIDHPFSLVVLICNLVLKEMHNCILSNLKSSL